MKIFIAVAIIWMGVGLFMLKEEIEGGNKKLSDLKFKKWAIIFLKVIFFGPYTRSKVLAKL